MRPTTLTTINLAKATVRWAAVRLSHAQHIGAAIPLRRFDAIDGTSAAPELSARGRLSPAEAACRASHLAVLRHIAGTPGGCHWITEDDVMFGPQTLGRLGDVLGQLTGTPWDILLTDAMVTGPASALDMWGHALRQRPGTTRALDLAEVAFGGSASYIVNEGASNRVLALVAAGGHAAKPWDIELRDLCRAGKLRAFVTLPFLTRVAAGPSQIQQQTHLVDWWSAFRELLSCDCDAGALEKRLDQFTAPLRTSSLFGRIMAGMTDPAIMARAIAQPRVDATARASSATRRSSDSNSASSDAEA